MEKWFNLKPEVDSEDFPVLDSNKLHTLVLLSEELGITIKDVLLPDKAPEHGPEQGSFKGRRQVC